MRPGSRRQLPGPFARLRGTTSRGLGRDPTAGVLVRSPAAITESPHGRASRTVSMSSRRAARFSLLGGTVSVISRWRTKRASTCPLMKRPIGPTRLPPLETAPCYWVSWSARGDRTLAA
jgi:hypothetical protein